MQIEARQPEKLTLRLSADDLQCWANAVNEVCNGFDVANFQAALGMSEESANALLEKLHGNVAERPREFCLDELQAVRNALTVVLGELSAGEFLTRMGCSVRQAEQMRNALDALAGQMHLYKTA